MWVYNLKFGRVILIDFVKVVFFKIDCKFELLKNLWRSVKFIGWVIEMFNFKDLW